MIVEVGRIVRAVRDRAWVEAGSRENCARCAEGRGCGGGLLGRWLGNRLHLVEARNPRHYPEGSWVELALPDRAVLVGALMVYVPPLMGMLLGAVITAVVLGLPELAVVLGAVFGLFAGGLFSRLLGRRAGPAGWATPNVVRLLDGPPTGCSRDLKA